MGRLREQLVPLVERFQRLAGEHLGALKAMRGEPSGEVERSRPIDVKIARG